MNSRSAFLLVIAAVQMANAQTSATVVGTVRDETQASVPGASAVITNNATGLQVARETGADGSFLLPSLPPGSYRLTVKKSGFQQHVHDGIVLAVNDRATIDVTLALGATAESVTVTGEVSLLEAQTGTLRGVIEQKRIVDLPLNGRNMTQLVALQAGVIQTADNSGNGEGIGFAVNGSRGNGMYFLLDGGYNTSTYRNFSGTFPNPDAVQEFSLQRSNFSAEYANSSGAVMNVITKSGTNQFHGSAFHFFRNAQLNARNFFAATRDSLKRNQFGGTLGGPLVKDRLFFFGSYQGTTLRSDPQLGVQYLPTAAQRTGDFSGVSGRIIDPLTNQPFPNNRIPANRIDPVAANFLQYIAVPSTPDGRRLTGAPNISNSHEFIGKIDWNLSRHRISGKIFQSEVSKPFYADPNDIAIPLVRKESQPYTHLSFNHLYMHSAALLNSVTLARRYRARFDDWAGFEYPINFASAGVKEIAIKQPAGFVINVNGYFNVSTTWPYQIEDGDWHLSDTLTLSRGKHELKVGGEWIRSTNVIRNDFRTMGLFTFDGRVTGNSLADFLTGNAYSFQQGGGEFKDMTGNRVGFFVQDDWRITPSLTLNLGLRWDPTIPFKDSLGRLQCIRPGNQSSRFPKAPAGYLSAGDAGCPEGGFDAYYKSIAPRFGFAWRTPLAHTVVRGGYGLFWTPLSTVLYNGFVNGAPFSPQVNRFGIPFGDPYQNTPNPFPEQYAPFTPSTDASFTLPLGLIGNFDPGFRPSYQQVFNFTVEREFGLNLLARVSYVGNLGRHLPYSLDTNYAVYVPGASTTANIQNRRPFSSFGQVLTSLSEGNSSYHSLQASLERRFAALSFDANYTWSKAIDEYSQDATPGQSASLSIPFSRKLNRAVSDFDVPHRLVISGVWSLPSMQRTSPVLRWVAGGWELSGIFTSRSGLPFSVFSGRDNALSGISRDYPDLIGLPSLGSDRPRGEQIARYSIRRRMRRTLWEHSAQLRAIISADRGSIHSTLRL